MEQSAVLELKVDFPRSHGAYWLAIGQGPSKQQTGPACCYACKVQLNVLFHLLMPVPQAGVTRQGTAQLATRNWDIFTSRRHVKEVLLTPQELRWAPKGMWIPPPPSFSPH